jgi:hypothetical protein
MDTIVKVFTKEEMGLDSDQMEYIASVLDDPLATKTMFETFGYIQINMIKLPKELVPAAIFFLKEADLFEVGIAFVNYVMGLQTKDKHGKFIRKVNDLFNMIMQEEGE